MVAKKYSGPATKQDRGKRDPYLIERGKCGRRNRRFGKPRGAKHPYCRNTAGKATDHVGTGACWRHGGRVPRGVESHLFEDGRHVIRRLLDDEQRAAYEAWLNDPSRFDHGRQGAGLEVLLSNQFGRLKAPSLSLWKLIDDGWKLLQRAKLVVESDPDAAVQFQADGLAMIGQGVNGYRREKINHEAVRESRAILTEQRRVVEAENRREHREQEQLTLHQYGVLNARLMELFWRAIEAEVAKLKDSAQVESVQRAMIAGIDAWRTESDRWLRGERPIDGGLEN